MDEPSFATDTDAPSAADAELLRAVAAGSPAGSVLTLQRAYGNQVVQRILGQAVPTDDRDTSEQHAESQAEVGRYLQRHPVGTELPTKEQDAAQIAASESVAEQPAAEGSGATTPTTKALSLAQAEKILKDTYGTVKTIVPGNIQLLDDANAMWAKYDEVCVAGSVTNPSTGKTWKAGDAKTRFPGGLNGFAWSGTVYVNKATALETTTPHEMLHLNTAAGFRAAVGETFNEGSTQYLALKAMKGSGITLKTYPYQDEVDLTNKLVDLVTEDVLIKAYFGGADTLVTAYEKVKGAGKFADLKAQAEKRDFAAAKALLTK